MTSTLIIDYLGVGLASARPATPNLFAGALGLYFATDTGALSSWDGTTWHTAATGALTTAMFAALNLSTLPTSDPGSGKPWLNGGVLQVGP
jgi:hypothetical protein